MKRLLASLLVMAMFFAMLPMATAATKVWDGRSSEPYAGGTGTEKDPYLISNGAQLYQLALDASDNTMEGNYYKKTKGLCYKLTQDVDMGNKAFPGIAYFSGTLDGAGYAITNLKIINTENIYTGLVRSGYGCAIRNITIKGSITGGRYTGGIAGDVAHGASVTNCINLCNVTGEDFVGGVVGGAYSNSCISSCANLGPINGTSMVGGIVGELGVDSSSAGVFACANAAKITGDGRVAGIACISRLGEISDCYNTGKITGNIAGGIAIKNDGSYFNFFVYTSYNCGIVSGTTREYDPTGELGANEDVYYLLGINESATKPSGAVGLTSEEMTSVGSFVGFDFVNVWTWDNSGIYNYPILREVGVVLVPCEDDEHEWNDGTILRAATCTEDGELLVTCTKCAAAQNQVLPALKHDVVAGKAVTPTCTETGLTAGGQCSRCDYTIPQEIVPALGHNMVKDSAVPATCMKTGLTEGSHCSRCSYAISQQVTPALGHNMIKDPAVPATCTESGLTEGSHCSRCDYAVAQDVIPATGHSYTSEKTEPNCAEGGYTTYVCSVCGDAYSDSYVDALGHTWDNGVQTLAPTCVEEGTRKYTCLTCGETKTEIVAAKGHSYTDTITKPTCTTQGYTTHTCSNCGDSYVDTKVAATGHAWNDGVVVVAATCTANGQKNFTCTACGEIREEVIIAIGHSYVDSVTKPTCTETGYTTHTCSKCGDTYKDTYTGATGHAWNNGVEVSKATCTEKGKKVFTCGNCGTTRSEEIAPLGHSYIAKVTAPTCTEKGYTTYTCSACGDSYVSNEVAATGHNYANGSCASCGEEDPNAVVENPFIDVKESDYFYTPVLWAVQRGITTGTSATTFSPKEPCTRGQIVTFLWRACGSPEPISTQNPFTDVKSNEYYYKAVLWAVENGITTGLSTTTFGPNTTCTRGQVATFLWRSQGKPAPNSSSNPFEDVKSSDYYYEAVLWAVENNVTQGMGVGKFAPNDSCTRGQIVTFLYRALKQ